LFSLTVAADFSVRNHRSYISYIRIRDQLTKRNMDDNRRIEAEKIKPCRAQQMNLATRQFLALPYRSRNILLPTLFLLLLEYAAGPTIGIKDPFLVYTASLLFAHNDR